MKDSTLFADGFYAGSRHQAEWAAERTRLKTVRGEVLVAAFELEDEVCRAIGDLILPLRRSGHSPAWLQGRHWLLRNVVISKFDFRLKCDTMCNLMVKLFPRQSAQIKSLESALSRIRDVRNNLAHCPIAFECLRRPARGKWLRPLLLTAKGDIHLSDGYLVTYRGEIDKARALVHAIMRRGLKIRRPKTL